MNTIAAAEIEDFRCDDGDGDAEGGVSTPCGLLLHVECFNRHIGECRECASEVAAALDE